MDAGSEAVDLMVREGLQITEASIKLRAIGIERRENGFHTSLGGFGAPRGGGNIGKLNLT